MLLMIGMVEIGRVHLWHVNLAASAFSGALYGAQSPETAADTDGIREAVLAELTDLPKSATGSTATPEITVTMGAPYGDGFGKQQIVVTVNLSVPALFAMPGLPTTYTVSETASARVLQTELAS
jgi:hypothetical protein